MITFFRDDGSLPIFESVNVGDVLACVDRDGVVIGEAVVTRKKDDGTVKFEMRANELDVQR